jgi:hypothetical protein
MKLSLIVSLLVVTAACSGASDPNNLMSNTVVLRGPQGIQGPPGVGIMGKQGPPGEAGVGIAGKNGLPGLNGKNGVGIAGEAGTVGLNARLAEVPELPGVNCEYGGVKITSGLDTNRNGTLDPSEITATEYVCNGAPGMIVVIDAAVTIEAGSEASLDEALVDDGGTE